ncbi:tetratricopeptide repeat protein [Schumannella sp. 10F1B-5-1]|uniref:tetratricopeptide repeat protein n=1 Tax=Schumannella sp. 10F1B-5-1 TaxID=2590780 RepID=UPI002102E0E7|nr:tetratricopeptide repeat protein [Schumannella sp. 10F1B-5-1]
MSIPAPDRTTDPGYADWRARVDAVWADDALDEREVMRRIDALAAERPDDPEALAEAGGARDSAGLESWAEQLYVRALDGGLGEPFRSQVVIQLASTVRNLGRPEESIALIDAHYGDRPDHELAAAASAFRALALTSAGRQVEAVADLLLALAPTLPRYQRSVRGYARELLGDEGEEG